MARSSITVGQLAKEAHIGADEALIRLWDGGIDYVMGPGSAIRRRDASAARKLIGLPTKRELGSRGAWRLLFGMEEENGRFTKLLEELEIEPNSSRKLTKREINRLKNFAYSKGFSWSTIPKNPTTATTGNNYHNVALQPTRQNGDWKLIGAERKEMRYLAAGEARAIHEELVIEFANSGDPINPPGVRDENLLESAISRPRTSIGSTKKYPTVEMAAGALLHSLIHNHPFHNGNKRSALVSMLAFLDANGLLVTCPENELFKIVLRIAQHSIVPSGLGQMSDREVQFISEWIRKNSRRIEKGERTISFRRLRKLLSTHNCEFLPPKRNHVLISRKKTIKRFLRKPKLVELTTQTWYADEGRDIDKGSMAKVRRELELDEPNGIDSASFYDNAPAAAGDFILKYRKTLQRLARL